MKEKRIIPVNSINLFVTMTVMIFIAILTQVVIKELTIRDIENVARLTYINMFTEIEHEMIEPINTSLIMAQNTLLLDFMDQDTPETEEILAEYLSSIQNATGYESVFVIPDSTLNYYHPGGTDEKVDLESEHAYWYTNRIDATDAYGFVVNTENLDDWAMTVYVDANINDKEGNFVGITGVGKRITHLQSILTRYLETQGVEAYIVDEEGMIKVHRQNEYIKSKSFYELENIAPEEISIKQADNQEIEKMIDNQFFIIKRVPKLNWYLVVKNSSSELTGVLNYYSVKVIAALAFGAIIILLLTSRAISMYKKQIINLSNIDHLTEVSNRSIFEPALEEALKNVNNQKFCLVLFDLDNLKKINDTLGHDKGDYAIKRTAELAKDAFKEPDFVARVGGDEFAVMIYKPTDEARTLIENFKNAVNSNIELQQLDGTVSIGFTEGMESDTGITIYKRADEALYKSKNDGKNKITYLAN